MGTNIIKRVLIVDNDRSVADTLSRMVEKAGHLTLQAERVRTALELLKVQAVDAMLLDLHMPGPHGQDLLSFMKNRKMAVPPTIVVSGYLNKEAIGPLIDLGVCGIIAKPFDQKRLLQELGRVLEDRNGDLYLFCPQCGTQAQADDRFCRQCGTTLEAERECQQCGTPFSPGDRFCGNCGDPVATD